MLQKKRLITSALPYVNNIPHLGNIIGCVLSADVFARYCKIAGYETLYICGTDEYGTTTETRAKQEGLTPKQLCDKYHKIHKDIYDWFEIDFSYFGRTSSVQQTEIVQDIFWKLYNNGYIIKDNLIQPFCKTCNMFLADRYIEGTCPHCNFEEAQGDQCDKCGKLLDPVELKHPKCKACKSTPIFKETKHLFIDLEKLRPSLETWFKETSIKNQWSNNAVKTTSGWIEQGLKKRCITRDLEWGVPVPLKGYEDKVFYVWFDAPIGYISITACHQKYKWKDWWQNPNNVDLYQFMGKDNIPFHTVIFPSSLIGTKDSWTLLKMISSTEYLNYEQSKFSKSRGTGVFGDEAKNTGIDSDLFRYYLMRNRPERNDTQFLWDDFMEKANGEIIANYANLVNRVLQFVDRFFDGVVPYFEKQDTIFHSIDIENHKNRIVSLLEEVELKKSLLEILDLCSLGNKFFQDSEPWALIKTDKTKAANIIGSLAGFIKDISILLFPFIPITVKKVFKMLNIDDRQIMIDNIGDYSDIKKKVTNKPEILFNKIESELINKLKEKFAGSPVKVDNPFSKIYLKVAKIIEISRHPKADKLYIEKVDLGGGEVRQIVSGLVPFYKEEDLLGKKIVIVCNLKPANIRGIASQGMLLAAQDPDKNTLEVLSCDCDIGSLVTIDNVECKTDEITIDEFFGVQINVSNYIVNYEGKNLKVDGRPITLNSVRDGKVG